MITNSIYPAVFATDNADLLTEPLLQSLQKMASVERRDRAERFHRREDKCRSLVAEWLVRYTLKSVGLQNYNEITFKTNQYGKPVIATDELHFNVSHSGSWVVCAADIHEIGIDVEKIHKVDSGISDRFFAPAEIELLSRCKTDPEWMDLFFQLWVLKESYIKAIGMGLSCSLTSFAVLPEQNGTAKLIRYDESLPHKFFKIYNLDSEYKCSLCCSHKEFPEKVSVIPVEGI